MSWSLYEKAEELNQVCISRKSLKMCSVAVPAGAEYGDTALTAEFGYSPN